MIDVERFAAVWFDENLFSAEEFQDFHDMLFKQAIVGFYFDPLIHDTHLYASERRLTESCLPISSCRYESN